jgi:hypothetical protein
MRTLPGNTFEIVQADDEIEIDELLLEVDWGPSHEVSYGDGILTIKAANRTVSYGIGGPGSTPRTRRAILSWSP